jgi:hypothetical protein
METQTRSKLAANNKENTMPAMAACGVLRRSSIKVVSGFISSSESPRTMAILEPKKVNVVDSGFSDQRQTAPLPVSILIPHDRTVATHVQKKAVPPEQA